MKLRETMFFLIMAMLGAPLWAGSDWPAFRGAMNRSGYCSEQVGKPAGHPLWIDTLGCTVVSSPSIADGVLYLGGRDGAVYAIHAKTGLLKWSKGVAPENCFDASPLVHDGMVFIGSLSGELWVLDKERGEVIRNVPAGVQLTSPAVIGGSTIVAALGAPDKGLAAFGWRTMSETWRIPLDRMANSSPAVQENTCVCAISNGTLYGIDIAKKSARWSLKTGGGAFVTTPAINDNTVYFAPGNYDRQVYAVNLNDGVLKWKASSNTKGEPAQQASRDRNDVSPNSFVKLLQLSPDDRYSAMQQLQDEGVVVPKALLLKSRKQSGSDTAAFFEYGEMKTSSVAVGCGLVFVVQKELGYPSPRFTMLAFDKTTGLVAWRFTELRNCIPEAYCSSPIIANGKVFFGWGEGMAYAMDAATGGQLWKDSLQGDIIASPAIADGVLYFATTAGNVYAYDLVGTPDPTTFADGTYCYPNPAKSTSFIQYYMTKNGAVEVRIFDAAERMVKLYKKENVPAHTKDAFSWNVGSAVNGTYFAAVSVRYLDGTGDRKVLKIAVVR